MEWTELDEAYLEIFGEHPDVYFSGTPMLDDLLEGLSAITPTVVFMPEWEPIVYPADGRPDVEVLYEEVWCPGEVRMAKWVDGVERHQVQYRRPGSLSSHIDDFASDAVRTAL